MLSSQALSPTHALWSSSAPEGAGAPRRRLGPPRTWAPGPPEARVLLGPSVRTLTHGRFRLAPGGWVWRGGPTAIPFLRALESRDSDTLG